VPASPPSPAGAKGCALLAMCLATIAALGMKDQTQEPVPPELARDLDQQQSFLDRQRRVQLRDSGAGWFSFPSGHTTLITAPTMVVCTENLIHVNDVMESPKLAK
jgi:membrane-associated phospholipid phosphatase